ncbi:MAG: AAA family ATPase [Candidatus Thermoplasmatota archaeon]|jgi:hypothetical protein|nr:AAA family ATPase [Candidatus Thermoplasmatota archaeon]
MNIKVPRSETSSIGRNWTLLYGRRKTGKTYLLKNYFNPDEYILVGREGTIWIEGKIKRKLTSVDELMDHIKEGLSNNERIVLDEFQRLPMDVLEWIAASHPSGQLVLSGSSLGILKRVLGPSSPLLGRFKELRVSLVGPEDLLPSISERTGLDLAPYLSDPWTMPLIGERPVLNELYALLSGTGYTVPSLVGEIFHEEDRTLSELYQGILSSIGAGRTWPNEIASVLYSKGLIKQDGASHLSPYLKALKEMGILEEIGVLGKKRTMLRFTSPVMTLYYYMESMYGLERGLPPFSEVKENLLRVHSTCMEQYLVKAFAGRLGGELRYSFNPELDGIVVDRKERPLAVLEVKWKALKRADIDTFRDKSEEFECDKFILTKDPVRFGEDDIKLMGERDIRKFLSG